MACATCGSSFTHVSKNFSYLKLPVGITIICDTFRCNNDKSPHYYTSIKTITRAEAKQQRLDKKFMLDIKPMPKNPNAGVPYTKRTDLGEMTPDEIRIRDKVNKEMEKRGDFK